MCLNDVPFPKKGNRGSICLLLLYCGIIWMVLAIVAASACRRQASRNGSEQPRHKYVYRWAHEVSDSTPIVLKHRGREVSDSEGVRRVAHWIDLHENSIDPEAARGRLALFPYRQLYRIGESGVHEYMLVAQPTEDEVVFRDELKKTGIGTVPLVDLNELQRIFEEFGTPTEWEPY